MRIVKDGDPPFDMDSFKRGIGYVESRNNPSAMNPYSSATGKYQMLYSLIDDQPEMRGVSRDSLTRNPALQELIMDRQITKGVYGPSLYKNAIDLEREYKPQLGDKWNFRLDEVAAASHFLGRQGAREWFASMRDGTEFSVPGVNKTPEQYLADYNKGINQ